MACANSEKLGIWLSTACFVEWEPEAAATPDAIGDRNTLLGDSCKLIGIDD